MNLFAQRLKSAYKAAAVHFLLSLLVGIFAAVLVFGLWYPHPYREFSGGRELFWLVMSVDVICGPLLTLVLYNPIKPRSELLRDLGLIFFIQTTALGYGVHTVWQVRPLFLVQEVDRFKVVTRSELDANALSALPKSLQPSIFDGPMVVAIRRPHSQAEREKVMFESLEGGRDYAERPEFYLPFEGKNALRSLKRAKPLSLFLEQHADQSSAAKKVANEAKKEVARLFYLPVMARQDWVAVLDDKGQIQGFLKGDGFK